MNIIASSPITSWQIDQETMETVTDFIFLGSKSTADGDCSHEIKRHLFLGIKAMTNLKESEVSQLCLTLCNTIDCSLLCSSVHGIFQARILEWVAISFSSGSFQPRDRTQVSHIAGRLLTIWATREIMTNLDSTLKSKDITLPTKVHLVKAMILPVVMYGCEKWTIKKAERRRIDAFEHWCSMRVPWTARRSNQSILKEISPEYSLEGLMLKLQYSGHLIQRSN